MLLFPQVDIVHDSEFIECGSTNLCTAANATETATETAGARATVLRVMLAVRASEERAIVAEAVIVAAATAAGASERGDHPEMVLKHATSEEPFDDNSHAIWLSTNEMLPKQACGDKLDSTELLKFLRESRYESAADIVTI